MLLQFWPFLWTAQWRLSFLRHSSGSPCVSHTGEGWLLWRMRESECCIVPRLLLPFIQSLICKCGLTITATRTSDYWSLFLFTWYLNNCVGLLNTYTQLKPERFSKLFLRWPSCSAQMLANSIGLLLGSCHSNSAFLKFQLGKGIESCLPSWK